MIVFLTLHAFHPARESFILSLHGHLCTFCRPFFGPLLQELHEELFSWDMPLFHASPSSGSHWPPDMPICSSSPPAQLSCIGFGAGHKQGDSVNNGMENHAVNPLTVPGTLDLLESRTCSASMPPPGVSVALRLVFHCPSLNILDPRFKWLHKKLSLFFPSCGRTHTHGRMQAHAHTHTQLRGLSIHLLSIQVHNVNAV